jgi:hypothetical protein
MEGFTAKAVFDLYLLLSDEDKGTFFRLVGRISTAEVPILLAGELSIPERFRFSQTPNNELANRFFPILLREARRLARENPSISDDEFDHLFSEEIKKLTEEQSATIAELERAQLKEERDPKKRMTERDDEILRLRDQEGKSCGEIPRMLMLKNQAWVGKDGLPMNRDAVHAIGARV